MSKKKILSLFMSLVMVLLFAPASGYGANTETGDSESEPIEISSAQELVDFAAAVNSGTDYEGKYIKLTQDIDLGNSEENQWTPIGIYTSSASERKPFCGTFDGTGKHITGMYMNGEQLCLGLFGYNKGTIQNLSVSGSVTYTGSVDNAPKTAGIAALNSGMLKNCSFEGNVAGYNHIGGIAGQNNGDIVDCVNHAHVMGRSIYTGGIAGNNALRITGCKNYGEIQSECNRSAYGSVVGGIAGQNFSGGSATAAVTNCVNYSTVSAVSHVVGGIVGHNSDKVENCNNYGVVTSPKDYVGGIVGGTAMLPARVSNDTLVPTNGGGFTVIKNCLNEGEVTGRQRVGGIAGYTSFGDYDWNGYIADCGNTGQIKGTAYIGGIVGYAIPRAHGNGYLFHDVIERCYNTGDITGTAAYVGGIVGANGDMLCNCYNTGGVTGGDVCVGGLAGMNNNSVKWGYNLGTVSDGSVHGEIVGGNPSIGTISECYSLDSSAMSDCGMNQNLTENSVRIEAWPYGKFTSGEIAYNLQHAQIPSYEDENGNTIEYKNQVWGQKLHSGEIDPFPVLTSSAEKTVYKVSFHVKDEPVIVDYSNRMVDPELHKPTDTTFMHWSVNEEDAENNPFDFQQPISEDTDFYAVFGTPKQVVFDADHGQWSDGSTTATVSGIAYNSAVGEKMPDDPQRIGFIFKGWFTEEIGGTEFKSNTAVTGNITLYAHWEEVPVPPTKPHKPGGSSIQTTPTATPGGLGKPNSQTQQSLPYIVGYPDGEFKPDHSLSRAEVATMLARLTESFNESGTYTSTFPDMISGAWYEKYIGFEENKNVFIGYPDGEFKPDRFITRAEFAVMIARYTQLDCTDHADYPFLDPEQWARAQIIACYREGYIEGYEDHTFRPEAYITRAEAVTIINRVTDRVPKDTSVDRIYENKFPDMTKDHWGYDNVMEATIGHDAKDFR